MNYTIDEIVKRLCGEFRPVGDSGIDEKRLENLKSLGEVVYSLSEEISYIHHINRNAGQSSIKQCSDEARSILLRLSDFVEDAKLEHKDKNAKTPEHPARI